MDWALICNLQVLAHIPPYAELRILPLEPMWPPDPDLLPEDMTLKSHVLAVDERWSLFRPLLRLITGDTTYAFVNFLMIMTRALELHSHQRHIGIHVNGAMEGLLRLQETTYQECKFVKLALITCRCAWRQYCME
jgi:hypothetical protein